MAVVYGAPLPAPPAWSPLPRPGSAGVEGRVLYGERDLALAQLRLGPGATTDEHAADYPIEVLALAGSGFVGVGAEVRPIGAGERCAWPAGVPHRLWTREEPLEALMLERVGLRAPDPPSEPDGEPIDPLLFGPDQRCFGCGPHNAIGMRLRFWRQGDEVVTRFRGREGWEGPPGIVHGGLQSTLADELGAWTIVGLRHHFGFTTGLALRYYRPARLHLEVEGRGSIVSETDGLVVVAVTLRQEGKRVLAGKISYACPTLELAEKMLGQAIPEAWKALTRRA